MRHHSVVAISLISLFVVASAREGLSQAASPPPEPKATVTVDATHPWVDSGLVVRKGERLSFETTGTIQWGSKPDQSAGPAGHGAKHGKLGAGGLIGRVGFTGKPFPIGDVKTPIAMPQSGKLFLGINDFIFKDNSGAFVVKVFQPEADQNLKKNPAEKLVS